MSESETRAEAATPDGRPRVLDDVLRFVLPALGTLAAVGLAALYPMLAVWTVVLVVGIIWPSVIVHEWGHFAAARRAGLDVDEFAVGLGRPLLRRVRKGTTWTLRVLPLGGYVRIRGMSRDPGSDPEPSTFAAARLRTQVSVLAAGVGSNLALAYLALVVIAAFINGPSWSALVLAPINALGVLWVFTSQSILALGRVLAPDSGVRSVLGMPESVAQGVTAASADGTPVWVYLALVLVAVNLSLALINALPLHPLDGSLIAVSVWNAVRRRRATRQGRAPQPVSAGALTTYRRVTGAVLAAFVAVIVGADLARMLGWS